MVSPAEIMSPMRCQIQLVCVSIAWLLAAPHAMAQVQMVFARENVRIDAAAPAPNDKRAPHPSVTYEVEVRAEDALRLEYIHTLNTLTDATGVMISFASPTIVALPAMKVYTPVDALFINDTGTVVQILPNVTLAELNQRVAAKEPVKAFLFLKMGQVAARGLKPRDVVAGSMFTPVPPVLE